MKKIILQKGHSFSWPISRKVFPLMIQRNPFYCKATRRTKICNNNIQYLSSTWITVWRAPISFKKMLIMWCYFSILITWNNCFVNRRSGFSFEYISSSINTCIVCICYYWVMFGYLTYLWSLAKSFMNKFQIKLYMHIEMKNIGAFFIILNGQYFQTMIFSVILMLFNILWQTQPFYNCSKSFKLHLWRFNGKYYNRAKAILSRIVL